MDFSRKKATACVLRAVSVFALTLILSGCGIRSWLVPWVNNDAAPGGETQQAALHAPVEKDRAAPYRDTSRVALKERDVPGSRYVIKREKGAFDTVMDPVRDFLGMRPSFKPVVIRREG